MRFAANAVRPTDIVKNVPLPACNSSFRNLILGTILIVLGAYRHIPKYELRLGRINEPISDTIVYIISQDQNLILMARVGCTVEETRRTAR